MSLIRMLTAGWAIALIATGAHAQTGSSSYWLMLSEDGHTWCGYQNSAEFRSVASHGPPESANVTYASGKLTELKLQFTPESGDWIVIDKYMTTDKGLVLQRTDLLTQPQLQVIQATTILDGKAAPLHVESVTTLSGQKAEDRADLDLPDVPVASVLSKLPFMVLVDDMRARSIPKLCRRLE